MVKCFVSQLNILKNLQHGLLFRRCFYTRYIRSSVQKFSINAIGLLYGVRKIIPRTKKTSLRQFRFLDSVLFEHVSKIVECQRAKSCIKNRLELFN